MKPEDKSLGSWLFKYRDYTPIPLIVLLFVFACSSVRSAFVGMLLVTFGELVRIYSVAFIGSISRTRKQNLGAKLIVEGPFSYVRNPLYVGNFFITLGIAVFGGNAGIVVLSILLFAFQYYHIVRYEEGLLFETFGEDYQKYCLEVPAWFPKKKPSLENLEWPDNFSPALKSERRTLTTIIAVLVILSLLAGT